MTFISPNSGVCNLRVNRRFQQPTIICIVGVFIFHMTRSEISQIDENVFYARFLVLVTWGREGKVPIIPVNVRLELQKFLKKR